MQDKYGRPLSDDGQWVWDGSAWRPIDGPAGAAGGAQDPGTVGYEPTMVAPRDYGQRGGLTGGQPEQPYYAGNQGQAPGPYVPGGPVGPGGPGGPGGPTPFYRKPVVIIGALLIISAVLVTVLLIIHGGKDNSANTTPTTTPSIRIPTQLPTTIPTDIPTQEPTSAPPSDTPPTEVPTTPPPTSSGPATISPGVYDCTSGGTEIGTVSFLGLRYTTSSNGSGTYQYDEASGDISFIGADLGDYSGTYDPSGPSMDLTSSSGGQLHCAQ